jgi:hypothetical protein
LFVLTTESKAAAAVRIGAGTALRERAGLLESLRPCFARVQAWLQAGHCRAPISACPVPSRAYDRCTVLIPREQVTDPVKSLATGLPGRLRFRAKGQLAIDVLADAYADGVTFGFICGDALCVRIR